jgi:hypothetical protein
MSAFGKTALHTMSSSLAEELSDAICIAQAYKEDG